MKLRTQPWYDTRFSNYTSQFYVQFPKS